MLRTLKTLPSKLSAGASMLLAVWPAVVEQVKLALSIETFLMDSVYLFHLSHIEVLLGL